MVEGIKVFVGVPSYDTKISMLTANALLSGGRKYQHSVAFSQTSLLAYTFNRLWCEAINAREKHGYTHFCMLHADIAPEPGWLDKLTDISLALGADILSAVVPIKNSDGLTSTAIDTHPHRPSRLTMTQVHKLGDAFTHPKLLVNTGLMLVDIRKDWVRQIRFHIDDITAVVNGELTPIVMPEDWNFSREARELGADKIYATRSLALSHVGNQSFTNVVPWGALAEDSHHGPVDITKDFESVGLKFTPDEEPLGTAPKPPAPKPTPKPIGEGPLPIKTEGSIVGAGLTGGV